MNKNYLKFFSVGLMAVLSFSIASCSRSGSKEIYFEPLKPVTLSLPNGLSLMALEDSEWPTIEMILYIPGGSAYDPLGQEGLSAITMQALRTGGTKTRTKEEVEDSLEFVGGSIEMRSTPEFMAVSLNILKQDLGLGLDLVADLLQNPAFHADSFETVKRQTREVVLRDVEEPAKLAAREFPETVYGPKSVWGRKVDVKSLDRIRREDALSFYQKYVVPQRMLVAMAGDIDPETFRNELSQRLGSWNPPVTPLPELPLLAVENKPGVTVWSRDDLNQATVIVGHLGAKRDNPDKFALLLMNYIMGGSGAITSRLGEEIRSNAGRAYSVWSDFGFGKDYGLFRAVAQTSVTNTEWVVRKMVEMIGQVQAKPEFKESEIETSKKAILRSLVFDFETKFSQVKELAKFRLLGYPDDYLTFFQRKMSALTQADLERVAGDYLHPANLKMVVVTNPKQAKELAAALKDFSGGHGVSLKTVEK